MTVVHVWACIEIFPKHGVTKSCLDNNPTAMSQYSQWTEFQNRNTQYRQYSCCLGTNTFDRMNRIAFERKCDVINFLFI